MIIVMFRVRVGHAPVSVIPFSVHQQHGGSRAASLRLVYLTRVPRPAAASGSGAFFDGKNV